MDRYNKIVVLLVAMALTACTSHSGIESPAPQDAVVPVVNEDTELLSSDIPLLSVLDGLHGAAAVVASGNVPVTEPFIEQNTSPSGDRLLLNATANEMAFGVFRINPLNGIQLSVSVTCLGPLWLAIAVYGYDL